MDVNDLGKVVLTLVLVGMILGVGVLILDNFGDSVKDIYDIRNETITVSSNTATTANDDVTEILDLFNTNQSVRLTSIDYVNGTLNFTTAGQINADLKNDNYLISYNYKADTTSTTTLQNVVTAVNPIASTWMALIVTVVALAIVLGLVIKSFAGRR